MITVQTEGPQEAAAQWVAALDAYELPPPLIREVFACFLLLRWVDHVEAEQEAMALFEDRPHQSLMSVDLQWRNWARLEMPNVMAERLGAIADTAERLRGDATHSLAGYLHALAEPLRRVQKINFVYLADLVRWVDSLPFETPSERRELLDLFDRVLAESRAPQEGEFASPPSIARLVAALAHPRPGERVYDPCFGGGGFLVAAWQQAEGTRTETRRPGPLLEVAGIERNAGAFLIGLVRLLLAGVDLPCLQLGDALERDAVASPARLGFDVVLADPPWGMKVGSPHSREPWRYQHFPIATTDSVGLFIQHALSQLKPNGRAVIAVPEGFLFRGGAERELRHSLLEAGQVEAVIGLPAGVYAPHTMLKSCLLVLNKQGGASRVRMADAAPFFESRKGRKAPFIRSVLAQQLADEVAKLQLRKPRELPPGIPEGTPGTGVLSRSVWDVSIDELAATDWDLTPRRREKGGLEDLLSSLREALGDAGSVAPLSEVAQVIAGRAIKSSDLTDDPSGERPVGYLRIKDLAQGRVGRCSSWLSPVTAETERRWSLLAGDVLLSKSGTIGKAALVRNGSSGSIAASGLYVLRVDQKRLDPGFLLAYLASPACQNWMAARSRGANIQHLGRTVLDELPIPLPPLPMQARAAAQYKDFGTDALTFLAQATGTGEASRLTAWLAELSSGVPDFVEALDSTPPLRLLEPLAALASAAQRWVKQEQVGGQPLRWLVPLTEALLPLAGIDRIPAGPGLLSVLTEAERGFQVAVEEASGHLPIDSQARAVAEKLLGWMRAAVSDLTDRCDIGVRTSQNQLAAGSLTEFTVELVNEGALPLRTFRVETAPDWGSAQSPYLAERGTLALNLRGDVPKQAGTLALQLNWSARTLTGQEVGGAVELALQIAEDVQEHAPPSAELGGSPYVTGSPLEPHHGHLVFFGREGLIEQISRQISTHGNVVLLEGNRRAGKTSILKHLEGSTAVPGWLAVYASLQGAEGAAQAVGVPTPEVFREIARCIATALTKINIDTPLPNGTIIAAGNAALGVARACRDGIGSDSPFVDFREYLELVLSVLKPLGLGLLLMLDEFDKLQEGIDNGVTSPQVPENIRFLIQSYPKFSAILTGSRRLKRLREEYWSALYGLGTSIPVTALDVASARRVVTEPVRDKLSYSNEAIERVVEITARQPYLMQCLCNRVFAYAVQTKARSITLGVINEVATSLVRDNEHFASLWDYAGLGPETGRRRRQLILMLCARSFKQGTHTSFTTLHEQLTQSGIEASDEALDVDLTYLRELELIDLAGELGDGHYRLAIPLMADWIEQQHDADVLISRARAEAEEEDG